MFRASQSRFLSGVVGFSSFWSERETDIKMLIANLLPPWRSLWQEMDPDGNSNSLEVFTRSFDSTKSTPIILCSWENQARCRCHWPRPYGKTTREYLQIVIASSTRTCGDRLQRKRERNGMSLWNLQTTRAPAWRSKTPKRPWSHNQAFRWPGRPQCMPHTCWLRWRRGCTWRVR